MSKDTASQDTIRQQVRDGYIRIAQENRCCCANDASPDELAKAIGYMEDDLAVLPESANMGLSCGNPTAVAQLKPGEVVLDLGSGGGFDVFIAARKVGETGRAIGVDMTPEMLSKARAAIGTFTETTGLANVEFRLGEIEHLPVADNSVDVIISNCVINLSPDKQQVWREVFRVLKPGGKACVSDLALIDALPDGVRSSAAALVGCIAGAVMLEETERMIGAAGLRDTRITSRTYHMDVMDRCNDSRYEAVRQSLPEGKKLSDHVVSADITTFKTAVEQMQVR